jgi:2-keto-4-pentenoate hydratase/2-oxohepta-3-ene-1,7-dioic acid hydratase in catechol pathway
VIAVDREVTTTLDYEVELGIVLATGGRRLSAADAHRDIAGYTIVNDVTARDLQRAAQAVVPWQVIARGHAGGTGDRVARRADRPGQPGHPLLGSTAIRARTPGSAT